MTTDAKMMNDIIEEPEKDTLLEAQPEPQQVLTVMSAKLTRLTLASTSMLSGRLAD